MILDQLINADLYKPLQSRLAKGFDFLQQSDLEQLAAGRHEIDSDEVFALLSDDQGKGQAGALIEHHRRYLDIQYVVRGEDRIGWLPTANCQRVQQAYDTDSDLAFYYDRPSCWLSVPAGSFAIFFPDDAHAPLGGLGAVRKVVVKVLLD